MQLQLEQRSPVRSISPLKLKAMMEGDRGHVLLDAREAWERQWGSLKDSLPFNSQVLESLLQSPDKEVSITVYCHYGVRSLDAAIYLSDQGFTNVQTLEGGVEAWSQQADPDFPRYPGHPC